jgi:hypothetical protein
MKQQIFVIFDWAGNELKMYGTFETFEEAWEYIQGELTDLINLSEDDYSEYEVRRVA